MMPRYFACFRHHTGHYEPGAQETTILASALRISCFYSIYISDEAAIFGDEDYQLYNKPPQLYASQSPLLGFDDEADGFAIDLVFDMSSAGVSALLLKYCLLRHATTPILISLKGLGCGEAIPLPQ